MKDQNLDEICDNISRREFIKRASLLSGCLVFPHILSSQAVGSNKNPSDLKNNGMWWASPPHVEWAGKERIEFYQENDVGQIAQLSWFPRYGEYPVKGEWEDFWENNISAKQIKGQIKDLEDNFTTLMYINPTECNYELAESEFESDIVLDNEGEYLKGWWNDNPASKEDVDKTYLMSLDLGNKWSKYMNETVKKTLKEYETDGVIFDRLDYDQSNIVPWLKNLKEELNDSIIVGNSIPMNSDWYERKKLERMVDGVSRDNHTEKSAVRLSQADNEHKYYLDPESYKKERERCDRYGLNPIIVAHDKPEAIFSD